MAESEMRPPWRKVLYMAQPFEDNYVDETFLEQMKTNANVREHDYWGMVRASAAITQQICAVLIFFSLFQFVHEDAVSAAALGSLDIFVAVAGVAILRVCFAAPLDSMETLGSCLLFCATLSILSPVLRTLTESFADDTIWALAYFLAIVHLVTHDYNYVNSGIGRFSGTISLNAAIFTAVLLGSRLPSNELVFAFLLFAIELFAAFPMFQRQVKRNSEGVHLAVAALLMALALALTWRLSPLLSAAVAVLELFLAFVCPLWFMHVQEYKNEILGPWDIVHIQPEQ